MDYNLFVYIEPDWFISYDVGFPVWQQGFDILVFGEECPPPPLQTWG